MTIRIKEPFRSVVVDEQVKEIKVTEAPLETLRNAIDENEIVSLRAVMHGMLSLMHYPYHTTKYDIRTYVHEHFNNLVGKIAKGEITAYTGPENPHFWEMYYVQTKDLLEAFDHNQMPSKGKFEVYSHHNQNLINEDRLYARDFRRAFLVAIGDAKPSRNALKTGALVEYKERNEQELQDHVKRMEKIRRPARPPTKVWDWAQNFWDKLEKYDINPCPTDDKEEAKGKNEKSDDYDFDA